MSSLLWPKIHRFLSYAALSYLEKALIFAFPLSVMYLTDDKARYNQIEFIFASAAVCGLFLDGGLKIYLLYAYKKSDESIELVKDIFGSFKLLLIIYFVIVVMIGVGVTFIMPDRLLDLIGTSTRALYLAMIGFLAVWYRIADTPSKVFYFSIPLYIAGGVLIWTLGDIGDVRFAIALGVPHLLTVLSVLALVGLTNIKSSIGTLISHIGAALKYGWPILATVALAMAISNFGKLYAYGHLNENEMFKLSFSQRLAISIQLGHVAICGYLSKQLFISNSKSFHLQAFFSYLVILVITSIIAYGLAWLTPYFGLNIIFKIDSTLNLIIVYTLLWCISSYLELYINRANKNIFILASAFTAASVFFTWIVFTNGPMVNRIATAMVFGAVSNLMIIVFSLYIIRHILPRLI